MHAQGIKACSSTSAAGHHLRCMRCQTCSLCTRRPITTFLPLAIVLGVSMFKEALEDIQRFQADREVNRRGVLVYNALSSAWVRKQWRDILVSPRYLLLTSLGFFAKLHMVQEAVPC